MFFAESIKFVLVLFEAISRYQIECICFPVKKGPAQKRDDIFTKNKFLQEQVLQIITLIFTQIGLIYIVNHTSEWEKHICQIFGENKDNI